MKVLFDCIVTQLPVSKCSTTAQFVTLANLLLKKSNIFIYWPIPEWVEASDIYDYFPKSDKIKYVKVSQSRDRMREYNRIPIFLEDFLSFTGSMWDWDVLVTVRSTQVAMMRVMSTSPRQRNRKDWTKKIILIEEMLILSKKPTIAMSNEEVQDRLTVEGYLAADKVFMLSYHEKSWVMEVAKRYFSMAKLRDLGKKIIECCQLDIMEFSLKKEFKYFPSRKLNVAFIGRMAQSPGVYTINEILKNQFIMNSAKVNPFICTVSRPGCIAEERCIDTSVIPVLHPNREEFRKISKESLDLGVFFHVDAGLMMSMVEPLCFGVPEIVRRDSWSVGMFGADYPFFVNNEIQGYAYIKSFLDNYDSMYARFEKWYNEWFVPTYTKRTTEEGLYENIMKFIEEVPSIENLSSLEGMRNNSVVKLLIKYGSTNLEIMNLIASMEEIKSLANKVDENYDDRGLVWGTPWNEFRLALKFFYGYEDASAKLGHLQLIAK